VKQGDVVVFTGASDEQVRWGSCDDPRDKLVVGESYTVSEVEEHSWHTKISVVGVCGRFNSVSFTVIYI
jgi:hypothetical protein